MKFTLMAAVMSLMGFTLPAQSVPFTSAEGAFSITFNSKPSEQLVTQQTPEGISVDVHLFLSEGKGSSFFVIYNSFETGFNIEDDSIYLAAAAAEMLKRLGPLMGLNTSNRVIKEITFDGYPGRSIDLGSETTAGQLKIVLRSNRAYFIGASLPIGRKKEIEDFISSFKFTAFKTPSWTSHTFNTLKLDLPSPPVLEEESSFENDTKVYYTKDVMSGDCYAVLVQKYSRYTMAESDSAILEERISLLRPENTETSTERFLTIDGRLAKEIIVKSAKNTISRYVTFTHGNNGYILITTLNPKHNKLATTERFFTSGKFTSKPTVDLLSDKSSLLLSDLTGSDTALVRLAKAEIPTFMFSEKYRTEIMKLIDRMYEDDADLANSRKELLFDALAQVADESVVSFTEKIFPSLKKNVAQEFSALVAISQIKTRSAIDARIRLLHQHVASDENAYYYVLGLNTVDSADQRYLYDKTITLLKNSAYKVNLYYLMNHLLTEKRLIQQDILSLKPTIISDFNDQVKVYKADTTYSSLDDLIDILGHLDKPDAKTVAQLKELSKSFNTRIGIIASTTLLRHKQSPDVKQLNAFVKDPFDRLSLYDKFESAGLLDHYPKAYRNQDSLVVAQAYSYVSEDDFVPSGVKIIHQSLEEFGGKKMKFYVVQLQVPDEEARYLGTFGPFDPVKISTWGDFNYVDYEADATMNPKEFLLKTIAELSASQQSEE